MKRFVLISCIAASSLGCSSAPESASPESENVDGVAQPQIVPGAHVIRQAGALVASSWRGTTAFGDREYWVRKTSYSPSAARTYTSGPETCSTWKARMCGAEWAGATYYVATWSQSPLACAAPPSPIKAPAGAISFLGTGSYVATDSTSAFAWTFVQSNVEYWAMKHPLGVRPFTSTTQTTLTPPYASFSTFVSSACASGATIWYTSTYTAVPNFCSVATC